MRFTLPTFVPRNPCAVPARQRRAGAHGPSRKTIRQIQQLALRRELSRADTDRRSP